MKTIFLKTGNPSWNNNTTVRIMPSAITGIEETKTCDGPYWVHLGSRLLNVDEASFRIAEQILDNHDKWQDRRQKLHEAQANVP